MIATVETTREAPQAATDAASPLRLTFCPQCDYSLIGLPEAGVCPKCGGHYDQTFVIIRARPNTDRDNAATTLGAFTPGRVAWLLVSVVLMLMLMRNSPQAPIALFFFAYVAVTVAIGLLARATSPRPGEVLVWMSPEGIGIDTGLEPSSFAAVLRVAAVLMYCIGYPLALFWPLLRVSGPPLFIVLAICATFSMFYFLLHFGGRPKFAVPPEGARPGLIAWRRLQGVTLDERRGGRWRLRALHKSWVKKSYPVKVELLASPHIVGALRERLLEWRVPGISVKELRDGMEQANQTSPFEVGKTAPKFSLPASSGETISLADFAGKKTVVLYFYPRADTPGCTKEACGFRDALADFDRANVAVLGISPDTVEDVTKFAQKFHLNFPLLADAEHAVAEKYGVWQEKSMYGKKYWGAARTTFVIGKDGRVKHVFEKVRPEGHDREVIEWIRGNE